MFSARESLRPAKRDSATHVAQREPSIRHDRHTKGRELRARRRPIMRGVAAGRSAQRACERSSDWRRGAAGSPDPYHVEQTKPRMRGGLTKGSTRPDYVEQTEPRMRGECAKGSPDLDQ